MNLHNTLRAMKEKQTEIDKQYMQRCLQLAKMGEAHVSPNPMVGAVVVHNGMIIGEGYHAQYGKGHAEVNAIASVAKTELLPEATIYVSLEPCSHHGKTPPCSELIIAKGIARVVVGCLDPFPAVSGRGVKMLRDAGIEVTVGVLQEECREINRIFMRFHEQKRPYITLKWAESADGYIDHEREPNEAAARISNSVTTTLGHKLRALNDAIMVGTGTAKLDNPSLSLRHWCGVSPLRITIDRNQTLPNSLQLFSDGHPTLLFTHCYRERDEQVEQVIIDPNKESLTEILNSLYNKGVQRLLVEGGSQLLQSFIAQNYWDEAQVERGAESFNGGVPAPHLQGRVIANEQYDKNWVIRYKNG